MRVTQNMLANNMLRNISSSYSKLGKYMEQLNTGKKVHKPSDDPVIVMKGMSYRSEVSRIGQYMRNTGEVHNWMDNSDAALDKATKTLQKLQELAVQASNDTYDAEARSSIAEEAAQLKEHLISIANTSVNGKYIFNGTNTTEKPYDPDGNKQDSFNADTVLIEIAPGVTLEANVNGDRVFGTPEGTDEGNVFEVIDTFINRLTNEEGDISASIEDLEASLNQVINARADLGARMNRLDLIEDRLSEQELVATNMMSKNEDIDYEKVITDLITQESIHRAALAAGSKIIQPSLLDFLR
ncbi:flagellar hook-associated protein FlgL [Ornithinibacillus gellani]|uniref:flagellar hook-associated protein FlgL n=1 Tax=Ornithinibacillus gellani TaxID=2293253 RepID=UPI000F49FB4B|nr:flagellar hook-associated protein FlgL [Ornithinibacillus gellani]TQS74830.1 flagellar hook-associated protein FlgL [Ornithinibacillus gellani]